MPRKSENTVEVKVCMPAWEAEIATYLAEKQGLTLSEMTALFLRQWACDAYGQNAVKGMPVAAEGK